MRLKPLVVLATAILAAGGLAACGSSSSGASSPSGSGSSGSGSGSGSSGSGSQSSSSGSSGGSSFSVYEVEPDTLVPGSSTLAYDELTALFAPLVSLNPNGSIQYDQAQSLVASDHDKTWTLKIRPGWTFQNGQPVTASSYALAWNTTAYGPNAMANSGELSNIVGYSALNPKTGKPKVKTLSGVKVLDKTTLVVHLVQPDSQFPYELTQNQLAFYPLPNVAVANLKAYDQKPIGDGPYEMNGSWQHNVQIAMKAYPGYAGPDKPKTKNVVFKIYSNADTAYTDAQAGNTDIVLVPQDKFLQYKKDFPGRYLIEHSGSIDFLGFPLFDKQWQNIKLREAISLAINRTAINQALFGDAYSNATSMLSTALIGGSTDSCKYCGFDPAKAKQLLAQAGGFHGTMNIEYPGGAGYDQTFQAIANQIRENLGIKTIATPSSTFADFLSNLSDKKYTSGPFRGHWGSLYPSAQNTLEALFTAEGDGNMATYYSNPAVSKLIAEANAAPTLSRATDLYHQAERTIMADFPVVPLFFDSFPYVLSDRVSNVKFSPGTGDIEWWAVTVK